MLDIILKSKVALSKSASTQIVTVRKSERTGNTAGAWCERGELNLYPSIKRLYFIISYTRFFYNVNHLCTIGNIPQ